MDTFLLPIVGLTITSPWQVGRVQLHPGTGLRHLLGNKMGHLLGNKVLGDVSVRFVDELEQGTVAIVEAADVDAALDLVTQATDLLRVFQKKGAIYPTTMFGLPGQLYRSHIRYLAAGDDGAGPGIRIRGEAIGCTFNDAARAAWLSSQTFASLAALVGVDQALEEGYRRALLGVQLLSQSVLEHRPAFKILNLVIALESMLLERQKAQQTLRLLRRATYFTCGRICGSMCGRDRTTCQFLKLNPDNNKDRKQLDRLRKLARIDPTWRCSERARYEHWYDLRSAVAHGDDQPVTAEDASQAEYWIFMWTVEPLLGWLVEHPVSPLLDLDKALAALGPVPAWQDPAPDPDTYEPDAISQAD